MTNKEQDLENKATPNGWIKLYRTITDKGWYTDSEYVHLWLHILLKANHEGKEFMWNGKIERLLRGQFVTGRKVLSKETGISESKIDRILKVFESEQQIKQQMNNKNRVISILAYGTYQDFSKKQTANEQQTNSKRAASEQQVNTNKNDKNNKNEKNILMSEVKKPHDKTSENLNLRMAVWMYEKIKENHPTVVTLQKARVNEWVKTIQLLRTADKRTHEEIVEVFEFAIKDEFWKDQIQSVSGFRKKYDKMLPKVIAKRNIKLASSQPKMVW